MRLSRTAGTIVVGAMLLLMIAVAGWLGHLDVLGIALIGGAIGGAVTAIWRPHPVNDLAQISGPLSPRGAPSDPPSGVATARDDRSPTAPPSARRSALGPTGTRVSRGADTYLAQASHHALALEAINPESRTAPPTPAVVGEPEEVAPSPPCRGIETHRASGVVFVALAQHAGLSATLSGVPLTRTIIPVTGHAHDLRVEDEEGSASFDLSEWAAPSPSGELEVLSWRPRETLDELAVAAVLQHGVLTAAVVPRPFQEAATHALEVMSVLAIEGEAGRHHLNTVRLALRELVGQPIDTVLVASTDHGGVITVARRGSVDLYGVERGPEQSTVVSTSAPNRIVNVNLAGLADFSVTPAHGSTPPPSTDPGDF
jgi:hypothetical protein